MLQVNEGARKDLIYFPIFGAVRSKAELDSHYQNGEMFFTAATWLHTEFSMEFSVSWRKKKNKVYSVLGFNKACEHLALMRE